MWKPERNIVCFVLLATLATATLSVEDISHQTGECDTSELISTCKENERCVFNATAKRNMCICQIDYDRYMPGSTCVQKPSTVTPQVETTTEKLNDSTGSSGSSVAVGLLVPTFIILLGVLGFCAARRYRLLPCRRNLYGNVLVTRDDDDDDPPIA